MTRSTDGEGNTTTYEYNGINQPAVMTDPEGNQETYVYDAEERLCQKTDRNGIETRYAYNLYGNLLERRAGKPQKAAELSERYEYTAEGLLKSAIAQGMRYDYTYDVMDRLSAKRASGRTLLAFAYDKNGNLTRQTDVTGKVTEYRYDLSDRIAEVWDDGKQIAGYDYNADGTVKRLHCGSLYTEYAYDADRNLTGLKTMLGSQVLADNHYRYDGNGNRVEKRQKYGTTTYSYDSMNRLATVEYAGFAAVEGAGYVEVEGTGHAVVAGQNTMDAERLGGMSNRREQLFYDKAGNRTKRICNGMEEQYQYDKRNRLTVYTKGGVSKEYEYDNAGNLIRDDKARYEYDVFNRNTKVETFNGNIQINRYDAEGLRHEMEENGKLVSFIFRGTEIAVEETKEDKIRYIRTGKLLASDAECARTYYHYAADEMGSITHVVDSEEGNVLNHDEYDAWGNLTVCEEKAENRFRFNGQQYDPISQQYYLRARYYNPVIGRFTQEDSYCEDGLNLYAYCRNNPVYYVDPSGNICETRAKDIMGKLDSNQATRSEQKKLAAYLRNKDRNGGLTTVERSALNKVDGYTYLNRYDNPKKVVAESGTDALEYKIKQAEQAQKSASELSDKYGYGVAPKKTVASDGTTHTLSGWKTLDENSEFTRVSTDDVINKSNEIGHKLRNAGANDQGVPGRYNASHAEKQLSIISDKPIGISQPMCTDCQGYFKKLAIGEGREYVTADPDYIRIFNSDGTVNEIKR